jgi:hypothetical protein
MMIRSEIFQPSWSLQGPWESQAEFVRCPPVFESPISQASEFALQQLTSAARFL